MAAGSRQRLWLEVFILTGIAAITLLAARGLGIAALTRFKYLLVPAVFLYAPLVLALVTDRDFRAIGLGLPDWEKAALDLLLFTALVLPAFLSGWWTLFHYGLGVNFSPRFPENLFPLVLWQVLGIALPEEVFFRGFLQDRLNKLGGRNWKAPGAIIGPGLLATAVIFMLAHYLAEPRLIRLLVFFPGLLFGYLRERSGSVAAPIAAHALANLSFLTLQSWAS